MTEREDPKKTGTTKYIDKDGKRLRCGFTTGSCAAAAAAAAAQMLLTGEIVQEAELRTPGGPVFNAQIHEQRIRYEEDQGPESARPVCASCAVRKDGGDDPDITTGTLIEAEVTWSKEPGITIDGGTGIGRVTKPGLDQWISRSERRRSTMCPGR